MTSAKTPASRGPRVPSPPDTLDIALSLARAGWPVFPVSIYEDAEGRRAKVPAVKWKADATTDEKTIKEWWRGEHAGRWIGVHAGAAKIVVLDADPAKKVVDKKTGKKVRIPSGFESLEAAGLTPPETFAYDTHRAGGRHFVYAAPEGVELTIARDLVVDGKPLPGIDVRSGAGLMVYYGPKLDRAPVLAAAPDWLLVARGATSQAGQGNDRAPSADEEEFRSRLAEGKAPKAIRERVRAVEFPEGAAHDAMLEVVTALVGYGVRGERGIAALMDETRERYVVGGPDRPRDWDNAVEGSVKRLGLPLPTFDLDKAERREIKARNDPKAQAAERREYVADKIEKADTPHDEDLSDDALAERFADLIRGSWAADPGLGLLRYDGVVWKAADEAILVDRARVWLRDIRQKMTAAAIRRGGDKVLEADAKRLGYKGSMNAVTKLSIGILLDETPVFDRDPDLLNCPNGVVDLRTGELREHRADDYFTKVTAVPYIPGAVSDDWNQALRALPKDIRPWVKVRLGQAITGRISRDKSVPFFLGGGDNGKSAVLGAARACIGSFSVTVPERLLLGNDNDHPTEIMTLRGARMAVFEELPRGGRINAQRMKLLAGTNELTARLMGKDFVTFPATHTLIGSTNHLPLISDVDDAIWNRVAPVPFPYKYSDHPKKGERQADPGLRDRLAEKPQSAVLAWLVEGAIESYRGIPEKPGRIVQRHNEWRADADPVVGFVRDCLTFDKHSVIAASDLYSEFGRYLEGRGQTRWSDNLIAVSLQGHSSLDGITKRQLRLGPRSHLSRPSFSMKPIAARVMAWHGIRFRDDANMTEAERDAATLADLERAFRS